MDKERFVNKLDILLKEIRNMVIDKNIKYGFSIFNTVKVNGKEITPEDRVMLRLVEKMQRIENLVDIYDKKEEYKDIIGYLLNIMIYNEVNQ